LKDIVVVYKTLPTWREGFFDLLSEKIDYWLIASDKDTGKILASKNLKSKKYMYRSINWKILGYIIFPFLFFSLIRIRPKVIVAEGGQNTFNNMAVWLYCKLFSCKYIIWDLGKNHMPTNVKKSFTRKLYDNLYNFILQGAQQVYTYHDVGKKYFISEGFQKNIVPLKNTVDTRIVLQALDSYDNKEQDFLNARFNKYKYHILYVGALHQKKSLEDFKKFMDMLPNDYSLVIVGSGNEQYVNKLKKLLDDQRIYFEGFKNMEQLQYYYNHMDFLLLPGLGGLGINQAMAFGIPVICTLADGIEKELIINDNTGYIYTSIEDAVQYILAKNKEDWERMGLNAKKLIFSKYTIEKMVDRFVKGLKNV
jgi:glycosyltransferase involved in cell wall biosynthesis